jgi:hypothetical protein
MAAALRETCATAVAAAPSPHYLSGTKFATGETPLPSLYDASIPVYVSMLKNLSHFMDKAEAHAASGGPKVEALMEASLGHGMANFTKQIQLASDAAKGGAARLAGVESPAMPDTEATWAELKARIAKTVAFVEGVQHDKVHGQEDRKVTLTFPGRTMEFTGQTFLLTFSLPNFLFHITTAYAILRSQGVPLGKMDFLAGASVPA